MSEHTLDGFFSEEEKHLVKDMTPAIAAGFLLSRRKAHLEAVLKKETDDGRHHPPH